MYAFYFFRYTILIKPDCNSLHRPVQILSAQVAVYLCRLDVRVAHELLNLIDRDAVLH